MKIKQSMTVLLLELAALQTPWLLTGCGGAPSEAVARVGQLSLPLSTTAASGNRYRLQAVLPITGQQTLALDASGDVPSVSQLLEVGEYQITLPPDWQLLRLRPDGTAERVQAELLVAATQSFEIRADAVSRIVYRFRAGDELISFDTGTAEVALAVEETQVTSCNDDLDCERGSCALGVCGTLVQGILADDASWTAADSPYVLGSTVQVGATLDIGPGALVIGNDQVLEVHGDLRINGTSAAPATLRHVRVDPRGTPGNFASVKIRGAVFERGTPYFNNSTNQATLELRDSLLRDTEPLQISWPAGPCQIDHNVFQRADILAVTTQYATQITNNYFSDPTGFTTIFLTAAFEGLTLTGNTFATLDRTALRLATGELPQALDATANYWGSTDPAQIAAMIHDRNDDLNIQSVVNFEPFLVAPAATAAVPPP